MGPSGLTAIRQALLPRRHRASETQAWLGPQSLGLPTGFAAALASSRSKAPRLPPSPAQSGPAAADGFSPRCPAAPLPGARPCPH